jgi:hypothetical protein
MSSSSSNNNDDDDDDNNNNINNVNFMFHQSKIKILVRFSNNLLSFFSRIFSTYPIEGVEVYCCK